MTDPLNLAPLTADALIADPRLTGVLADAEQPLALLPVRLETRYAEGELLVRIYPDQLHVDAHDPRLSEAEQAAGQEFWRGQWRTGTNTARQQRLWAALAERFGPGRAGWVARATRPTDPAARPNAEVADGEPLSAEPTFPALQVTDDRRTPVARLLPQQWTVTAYAGGQLLAAVTGAPITLDPAVGPDLAAPLVADADDHEVAAVDTGMNWLIDFAAAEQLGMAVRLPVTGPVDLLVACGVRSGDAATGAAEMATLLEAQRYSAGLGFLAPEATTNNAEAAPSGWSSTDPGGWSPVATTPQPGTFGATASGLLGVGGDLFAGLPQADQDEPRVASAMSRALWPATWGYWLTQFIGMDAATNGWARDFAGRFVRPDGPLPALRIGKQPYGVLPVTSLGRFGGDDEQLTRLARVLGGLREQGWRPAVGLAPRIGRGDVTADLVDVLRLEGRSDDLTVRRSMGARFADNLVRFLALELTDIGFWNAARDRNLPIARAAGLGLVPGALVVHESGERPVTLPLVRAEGEADALRALLAADPDALTTASDPPGSVLEALLRHGLLREHADAASGLLGLPAQDAEFYGFGDDVTGWSARRATALPDGGTVRDRLADQSPTGPLAGFRAAVEALADSSAAALERQLVGVLDAAGYRLDAWVTALASARLAQLRDAAPSGLLGGGYGWVEGVQPSTAAPVPQSQLPVGEPAPLVFADDDPGFIHAPSVHQAQVAAMLRNAHLAHGGGEQDPFAISLTSERIRLARWVFDGVRAGRTMGAVLGYLVERDLHERHLDFAINDAREAAPLPGQWELPVEARRLDGLALHELWLGSEDHAVDHLVSMGRTPTDDERKRAIAVLRALNAAVDACADALQAEQAHQFARGDLTRAVSSVGDVDRGLTPPPDLDFLTTPRTGAAVTHRVVLLFDPDAPSTPGWAPPGHPGLSTPTAPDAPRDPADEPTSPLRHPGLRPGISARVAAEPALDAWLGSMLGPATGHTVTLASEPSTAVPWTDLQLTASDFVHLASTEGGLRELAARAALASGAVVETAQLLPDADLLALLELGGSLATLITAAKPLDGAALQPPHADPIGGTDVVELRARVAAARQRVTEVVAVLDAALAADSEDDLRDAVVASWTFGVGEAGLPSAQSGWDAAAARVRADLAGRLAFQPAPSDDVEGLLAEARALLGPGFVAVPRFVPMGIEQLVASRDDPALTGNAPLAAEVWLTRMERVREPLARAGIALREAEAFGGQPLRLTVAQVPYAPGDTWNALPASSYVDGASSLLLIGGELLAPGRTLSGLLLDEWAEVVPSDTQTTGVAFRYDPPESMAPQAILLAVPPVPGEPWTVGSLNQVLIETLELAHLRAVPPEALGAVRQYLPASVLAFNTEADVPSTDPHVFDPAGG